ncbi:protein farnesyltransferase subunit beta [Nematocida minor]|uniref:protein farnesyltransferase subunit beta n=1 Tax=Nematocida minor TaxID=1912983 RepID=UPI00222090FB|nr:protein farnesyltransferase subunit beta [Nematocida minor]KAI5190541.1 protein farnesyltransferase subunit beta [Nematocida minor]
MYSDEGKPTKTSIDALHLNSTIKNKCNTLLNKESHLKYIIKQMNKVLPIDYSMLIPWVGAWMSNGLYVILGREAFYSSLASGEIHKLHKIANQIINLQGKGTGVSGGEGQLPNLGNTYAALVLLRTLNRLDEIDKKGVISFIKEMKVEAGFTMYKDGEVDPRSIYCAVASYSILFSEEIKTKSQFNPLQTEEGKEIFSELPEIVGNLQTYEGGFAASPGEEAHGGYTYCAIAALKILESEIPNENLLKKWLLDRQDAITHGFNGRTNKGVDSCYNFWVGACFKMIGLPIYSDEGLVRYTLSNCQDENGGVKNIPESRPDIYHTAYALLGLYIINESDFNCILGLPVQMNM